jgi:hypothetical protein
MRPLRSNHPPDHGRSGKDLPSRRRLRQSLTIPGMATGPDPSCAFNDFHNFWADGVDTRRCPAILLASSLERL